VLVEPATMSHSQPWVEAVKKPSRAGGNPAKARPRKALQLKRHSVPEATAQRSSATQQLAHWLEKLGMSEYAERFAENKIDVSVLRHLTDQDLKDIGVALGHRRKILAAIAEFAAATATETKFFEPEPKPPLGGSTTWGALATRALRQLERVLSVLSELSPMAAVGPVTLQGVCT
jgi:hypothetical protein